MIMASSRLFVLYTALKTITELHQHKLSSTVYPPSERTTLGYVTYGPFSLTVWDS